MRKLLFLFGTISLILFSSCSKNKEVESSISVDPTEWKEINSSGASKEFTVTLLNVADYIIEIPTSDQAWLSVKKNGASFTLTAENNLSISGESRSTTVTLKGSDEDVTAQIAISQLGEKQIISVNPTEWKDIPAAGASKEFTVTLLNVADYSIYLPIDDQEWVNVKKNGTLLTIETSPNYSIDGASRSTILTLKGLEPDSRDR